MARAERQQLRYISSPKDLAIVSAASAVGQVKTGVELFPRTLVSGPLFDILRHQVGLRLLGDIDYNDVVPLHSPQSMSKGVEERAREVSLITCDISQQVYTHAVMGRRVLTLGGDHSIAIGSVSGVARAIHEKYAGQKKIGVIWVDAHADINTPETSDSGNSHGMPLAFLSGLARRTASGAFEWIKDEHRIGLDKLVYILRDIDNAERKAIEEHNIKVFTPFDITHLGIREAMNEVLDYLGCDTPIHLGFDIDGLDPSVAPCTGLPVTGGLSLQEGLYIAERLHRSGQLVSMDLVEVNPALGSEPDLIRTLDAAMGVVKHAFGGSVV